MNLRSAVVARERHHWRARLTVLLLSIGFALQLAYIRVAEEPFPAIMMPRFGWAGPSGVTTIDILIPEIVFEYADSTRKVVRQGDLLAQIPEGHHSVIMANVFSPLPSTRQTRRAPSNRLEPPAWLFPGYNLARISREDPEHVSSLRQWLRGRAEAFYSGAAPIHCNVDWYVESFPYDPANPLATRAMRREKSGRFELDLNEPARLP